ncbi:MAG: hypothetical protein N2491_09980, partial [Negativicutes bacterium]|nr:hypothetical protein [Negativicutes bacterium]
LPGGFGSPGAQPRAGQGDAGRPDDPAPHPLHHLQHPHRPPPAAPAGGAAPPGRQPAGQELRPVVLGIVGAGNTRAAIIQTGAESRAYRVNGRAGSYLITAINSSSVVLEGPDGRLIAPLER